MRRLGAIGRRFVVLAPTLFACCVSGVLSAEAQIELDDGASGATCEYFNLGMRLKWPGKAGEIDAEHILKDAIVYGPESEAFLHVDVTALVQAALARGDRALTLTFAGTGGGVLDLHSRESDTALFQPRLKIVRSDGRRDRLNAAADTFLSCGTHGSLGAQKRIKISAHETALMRFPLPSIEGAVERAELELSVSKAYGRGAFTIGLMRTYEATSYPAALSGLASGYPGDHGLASDPKVVFMETFDGSDWKDRWSYLSKSSEHAHVVRSDGEGAFEPLDGSALKVTIPQGGHTGLDLRLNFKDVMAREPDALYFRYYLRFSDTWQPFVDGGKLPGFAGTYGRAGWGQRRSDGFNGWSARGSFARKMKGADAARQPEAIGSYVYHADMASDYSGDPWDWGSLRSLLNNNQWYSVEQYVKLNTPGGADGELKAWVDGVLVFEKSDVRFRRDPSLHIEQLWMNVYHGGAQSADRDLTLYIDNVVVARDYIGPRRTAQAGSAIR